MDYYPRIPFRVGGSGAGMHLLFGNWAEIGEMLIEFDIYVCARCGRVLQVADEQTRSKLKAAVQR